MIICIDDWQWADDASKRIVESMLGSIMQPCLIVLATREHDRLALQMSGSEFVELLPLEIEEARFAIDGLVNAPGPFVTERIIEQAAGSPLFIEELCHSVLNGENSDIREDRGEWLEALIHSRFSRLPEEQAELVKIASVIGNMIPSWLFEQVTGVGLADPVLIALKEEDFIYTSEISGTLRFKHAITRDAIYQTVGLYQRQELHSRIVEALHRRTLETGEEEEPEGLAFHYSASGNAERATYYANLAGERAMAASALDRAQSQFRTALEQIAFLGDSAEVIAQTNILVRKFGLSCVVDPSWDQLSILKQATHRAAVNNDSEALAWAEYWLGSIYYGLGEARRAITHLEVARRAAVAHGNEKQIIQIQATLGQAHATACEYEPALALLDEAISIKQSHRSGFRTSLGLSYSFSCKAFVLADQGIFGQAYDCFDQAIEVLAGIEHEITASVLAQRSASCLWQGNFDDALENAEQALNVAERVKARYLYAMSRALVAVAEWKLSDSPQALDTIIETTSWLESSASRQFVSLNYGWLASTLDASGRFDLARQYAARAFLRARKGDRLGEAMACRAMAKAAKRTGNLKSAAGYLERSYNSALARGSERENAMTQICEAELAYMDGEHERSQSLSQTAGKTFNKLGMNARLVDLQALRPAATNQVQ